MIHIYVMQESDVFVLVGGRFVNIMEVMPF